MSSVGHFLLERNLTSVVLLYISPLSTEIAKTTYSAAYRLRGSNSRPSVCKTNALPTELSLHIFSFSLFISSCHLIISVGVGGWTPWNWRDSNPWPSVCKTDALPTELQPHLIDFIQNNYFLICSTYNALTISVYFIIFFIISFILYKYYIIKFYKNQIYRSVITKLLLP